MQRCLFWVPPGLTLLAAFAGICYLAGTPWPWNRVVHEDGVRTLLGTLFFFEHATRELVPDLVLALGVAGAVRHFYPPTGDSAAPDPVRRRLRLALAAGLALLLIVGGTVVTEGPRAIAENLAQLHTRTSAPLVWGAHWRYHFLERFAQLMLAFSATGVIWVLDGRPDPGPGTMRSRFFLVALGLFAGLTVLFRPTLEPFTDATFLGHQARELFTHTLVTFPLALGLCLCQAQRVAQSQSRPMREGTRTIVVTGVLAVAAGLFLLIGSVITGAASQGQTQDMAGLVFPHFAEHFLGYLLVPAVSGLLYLWPDRLWRQARATVPS